jgi:PAS domain S-box-containing protein
MKATQSTELQLVRSLIEASLDPLFLISKEGKITDMNEAFANLTGVTSEKITGTDFADYFTTPQKAREIFHEILSKGSVKNSIVTIESKDSKNSDLLLNGAVIMV